VKLFDRTGVEMLAGSDAGSSQWDIPGFSLHQEFDLLAEAGLSPLKVLQMTTLQGAKFLHREKTMGSVAQGKDANLVLLDANPIASVGNLHKIAAVVRGGTYYSRDALNDMKKRTEDRQASAGN
jgi:imidazolonepropionase-like amidohydrolase